MSKILHLCAIGLLIYAPSVVAVAADTSTWPPTLPWYAHIVIVVEENKDFEEIFGGKFDAPYINQLAKEVPASVHVRQEHPSQGNYFWLFSGSNQNIGSSDQPPSVAIKASS
jgi:hypothetical protein